MKPVFFKCLTLLLLTSLTLSSHIEPIKTHHLDLSNRADCLHFLNRIASIESHHHDHLKTNEHDKLVMNELAKTISTNHDLELISLYQRAVRNFNSYSETKADPATLYYKHYQKPLFEIPKIDLILSVNEHEVSVITRLEVEVEKMVSPLILDGRDQNVHQVLINGNIIRREDYKLTYHELILLNPPNEKKFTIEIHSQINPFTNTSLDGLYRSRDCLITQCESEGARKIFFTLDRPDVLSRITTTIIADAEQYPYRLANGDLVSERDHPDGRKIITWDDPIPKPSYLFASVLGQFSKLTSDFQTRSGKEVELQVYVEPGKESRATFSLDVLKKAMEFDELFFDREYDLTCLKMVGIPDFNSGAMENKGLMIFNDTSLLVDSKSGTDSAFRRVATVVGHEYFHNWSGNRVTIRNWFEIALKEAFTDWRAIRFVEWLFGEEFIRPKDVQTVREYQFPEELSEHGHPIMVESYVDAHSIYDATTYVKGREVFRSFQIYVDSLIPNGFREVLNLYFAENDGKAVTFRELLSAADAVLSRVGKNSSQFERWFLQPGTPVINVEMKDLIKEGRVEITLTQSCPHPKTGKNQEPFVIPFSLELLGKEGIIVKKINNVLDQEVTTLSFSVNERPSPIFMHGFSAPVILNYSYSQEDLVRIMKYSDDAFSRSEANQKYSMMLIKEMLAAPNDDPEHDKKIKASLSVYADLLSLDSLSPLAKAQLLETPSIRAISQALNTCDFPKIAEVLHHYRKLLAFACEDVLTQIEKKYPINHDYQPSSEQMQIRELRYECQSLLCLIREDYYEVLYNQFEEATNFNDSLTSFLGCIATKNPRKKSVDQQFYQTWKNDQAVFNYWLSVKASSRNCTINTLKKLEKIEGYDAQNPNHIRSITLRFIMNLGRYHDPKGEGYAYAVDKILEIGAFNPQLAHNCLATAAFQDVDNLPSHQRVLMLDQMKRLQIDQVAPQIRHLVEKILNRYQ